MADDQGLIDERAAAPLLGLSVRTLQNDRVTGRFQIPYVRIGRAVRYRPGDLKRWVDARVVTPVGVAASRRGPW